MPSVDTILYSSFALTLCLPTNAQWQVRKSIMRARIAVVDGQNRVTANMLELTMPDRSKILFVLEFIDFKSTKWASYKIFTRAFKYTAKTTLYGTVVTALPLRFHIIIVQRVCKNENG